MGVRSLNNPLQEFLDTFLRSGTDAVNPAPVPAGLSASGGIIGEYVDGSTVYRTHVFTTTGPFNVTKLATDLPNSVDYLVVGGGAGGGTQHSGGGGKGAGGDGLSNTGGGGGGRFNTEMGGRGGSGIVIIAYPST